MARRQRLCPEITDPELRGFLDMVPSIRSFQSRVLDMQEQKGEKLVLPLEGRELTVYLHRASAPGRPVVYELHGGGFVFVDARRDDGICEEIAQLSGCNVIGIDYRLAPEAPYPAALNDLCDVIAYFRAHGQEYQMDAERIGLLGYSAGATLAAAAGLRAAAGEFPLSAVVLHYPYLDSARMPAEKEHFDTDMDPAVMTAFTKLYSKEEERRLSHVSPVYASKDELQGFAPAMILPAEKDALRDEGLLFAKHLKEAGAEVHCMVMPGVHHSYVEDAGNMQYFDAATMEDTKKSLNPFFPEWAAAAVRLSAAFFAQKCRGTKE